MGEYIKKTIIDIIKWGVVIAMAAGAFYLVCPKYWFPGESGYTRNNTITGTMEVFNPSTSDWIVISKSGLAKLNKSTTSTTIKQTRKEDYWKLYRK